jgi:hypothetical protein
MATDAQSVQYPWESSEYAETLTSRARAACPEWYDGPVYAYLPTRGITRHFIDTILIDDTISVADFVRANTALVVTAGVTSVLACALAVLLYEGLRFSLGPIGLVFVVLLTVGLVLSALGLLALFLSEPPGPSLRSVKLDELRPSYAEESFETVRSDSAESPLERNIRLVLEERIALWVAGLANGVDVGQRLDLTAVDWIDYKWVYPLHQALGLTRTQYARLREELLDELRSAATHDLIGGHWGRLVNRDGKLLVERRSDG